MKKHTSTILLLLISACLAATSAQGKTVISSKTKKALAAKARHALAVASEKHSKATHGIASDKVKAAIAAAKANAKVKDPDSLYDASNAQYLNTSRSFFNFGPKAQDIKYDKRMIMAAQIAAERAHAHSTMRCWMYVKNALVSANVISSRPTTGYAKEAGDELVSKYGFKKLPITDPYAAPLGSVLVYGGRGAGHVEIRTANGFVSDFTTIHASRRPLLGVFVKPS